VRDRGLRVCSGCGRPQEHAGVVLGSIEASQKQVFVQGLSEEARASREGETGGQTRVVQASKRHGWKVPQKWERT
jgi:hypothetical protein